MKIAENLKEQIGATTGLGNTESFEPEIPNWPILGQEALRGFAGDFVKLATSNSEADPAAVLMTFLTRFGVEIGNSNTMEVGDTKHKPILACVIVGSSSKARKGTSSKPVEKLFALHNLPFSDYVLQVARSSKGPFSSGEGIIYAIRDPTEKYNAKTKETEIVDPGVDDKRLFVMDEEFGGVLANTKREGNTLSMIIRQCWDGGTLDPLTKNNKIRATNGVVGWVSHVTLTELIAKLAESESFNGFANRILWSLARRQKLVPIPKPMNGEKLLTLQKRLSKILRKTQGSEITLGVSAIDAWCSDYYSSLSKDRPGLAGCTTNRGEAQALRLSMIYCLLDGETTISLDHLRAGVAVWEYCRQSANYIFAGKDADQTTQKVADMLQQKSMTATELHRAFGNHLSKVKLESALKELLASNRIRVEKKKTGGAPSTLYHYIESLSEISETSEISTPSDDIAPLISSNSLISQEPNNNHGSLLPQQEIPSQPIKTESLTAYPPEEF